MRASAPSLLLLLLACSVRDEAPSLPVLPGSTDGELIVPGDAVASSDLVMVRVDATYARPDHLPGGLLDPAHTRTLPIRHAELWVADSQTGEVYATGALDEQGHALVQVPVGRELTLGIAASAPRWGISVLDNTRDDALWTVLDTATAPEMDQATWKIHAGYAHLEGVLVDRGSGPFAILDTLVTMSLMALPVADTQSKPLEVHWSPHNVPIQGDIYQGEIGTSWFSPDMGLWLLGAALIDSDEYDETVIAHEWFHWFESTFSRTDTLGGTHGGDVPLQLSTAFSEGAATGFGNIPRHADPTFPPDT